eukprot:m.260953 g.260953  ORF g.260953 m.260953 type:complete len:214 (+) comp40921_c0_seq1:204-845(+)
MRAVIQRVVNASVTVDSKVISSIGRGVCVLVGVTASDTSEDAEYITRKLLGLRLWDDTKGKRWAANVAKIEGEILLVSQFTLYATLKGNKPDYHLAMNGDDSRAVYERMLVDLGKGYKPECVKGGVFGADMQVGLVNDGPVTIILDSNERNPTVKPIKLAENNKDSNINTTTKSNANIDSNNNDSNTTSKTTTTTTDPGDTKHATGSTTTNAE